MLSKMFYCWLYISAVESVLGVLLTQYALQGLYETVERPCPSVCLSHRQAAAAARAAGLLLSAQPAGDSSHRRRAYPAARVSQQQRRRSTALSSRCRQCHVDNRRTRLNSDFNNITLNDIGLRQFYRHLLAASMVIWRLICTVFVLFACMQFWLVSSIGIRFSCKTYHGIWRVGLLRFIVHCAIYNLAISSISAFLSRTWSYFYLFNLFIQLLRWSSTCHAASASKYAVWWTLCIIL